MKDVCSKVLTHARDDELISVNPSLGLIFLDEKTRHKEGRDRGTVLIELGGIVQLRDRGRRVGARITKTATPEFAGQILSLETSKEKLEDLTLNGFIAFREEYIFGYDPPSKS